MSDDTAQAAGEGMGAERLDANGMLSGDYRKSRIRAWLEGKTSTLYASDLEFLLIDDDRLGARLAVLGEPQEEWGQKYAGGGYLTRVDSDWMRERWPIEQWAWDNTRNGGVVGKRTIIVIEDWQDIRSDDLPKDRPADTEREVPHA